MTRLEPSATLERSHSLAEAEALVRLYAAQRRLGARAVYGILDVEDALAGAAELSPSPFSAKAMTLAYWLDPRRRSHGYATEAAGALAAVAFAALDITRVELYCDIANHASARIAETLGFMHLATLPRWLRVGDGERDMMVWVLDRAELARSPVARIAVATQPQPATDPRQPLWNELVEPLVAGFKVRARDIGRVVIESHVTVAATPYLQDVLLELGTKAGGAPWLSIKALIGGEALLEPRLGLQHNAVLAVGAIAIENRALVLRASLDPDGLDVERLAALVQLVAEEAARLRVVCMQRSAGEPEVAAGALQSWWTD